MEGDKQYAPGMEPRKTFKLTVKSLLFCSIFEVDPSKVCFCLSVGQQLKPINVDVALPHYTAILIFNRHANILCTIKLISLNCIRFTVK